MRIFLFGGALSCMKWRAVAFSYCLLCNPCLSVTVGVNSIEGKRKYCSLPFLTRLVFIIPLQLEEWMVGQKNCLRKKIVHQITFLRLLFSAPTSVSSARLHGMYKCIVCLHPASIHFHPPKSYIISFPSSGLLQCVIFESILICLACWE